MRRLISYLLWPGLLAAACVGNYYAMHAQMPMLWLNVNYFSLAFVILALERIMPHERAWLADDGQVVPDLGHTILSKASVQALIIAPAAMGAASVSDLSPATWWPEQWPLVFQIVLALSIAEIGFYAVHRLGHEWPVMWRFHAVHHSVRRLWLVNTGRFHFVDTLVKVVAGVAIAIIIGAPKEMIVWVSAITGFIGFLTHANVEMRGGWLNYIFNTPDLHRWHHSMAIEEGNRNYGENLMFMDQLFGTFFLPAERRPPADIGIRDPMPATLLQQILWPFRRPGQLTPPQEQDA